MSREIDEEILERMSVLRRAGVKRIQGSFSGCGDSGDCDSDYPETPILTKEHKTFYDEVVDYFSENHVDWDWCNNEGGGGRIDIDLVTGEWFVTGYYNEMSQVDADGASGEIEFPPLDTDEGEEVYN